MTGRNEQDQGAPMSDSPNIPMPPVLHRFVQAIASVPHSIAWETATSGHASVIPMHATTNCSLRVTEVDAIGDALAASIITGCSAGPLVGWVVVFRDSEDCASPSAWFGCIEDGRNLSPFGVPLGQMLVLTPAGILHPGGAVVARYTVHPGQTVQIDGRDVEATSILRRKDHLIASSDVPPSWRFAAMMAVESVDV